MLKNYFKIAARNLLKNKLFSMINILGLGIAIPFALISLMQVQCAYEFDRFHPFPGRTYRILTDITEANGVKSSYGSSPYLLAGLLQKDYPVIEKSTKIARDFSWDLTNKIKTIRVNSLFAEPTFFELFGFSMEQGNIPVEPKSIAMTHEMAELFFGDADPIGKILSHVDYGDLKVVGVLKPFKKTTHLRSDIVLSMATYDQFNRNNPVEPLWSDHDVFTYALLQDAADAKSLDVALNSLSEKASNSIKDSKKTVRFKKQALDEISPDLLALEENPGVESLLDLSVNFSLAVLILALAGFNYTNLTLARSISRAKEVGIRKVTGALRYQLIGQFIAEAVVLALLALVLGYFILKLMHQFVHVEWIHYEVENNFVLWVLFLLFTVLTGALAGVVPAWILSGFRPVQVLKGNISPASFGKMGFRKSLVVVQFVVTCCFIFMIGHMYSQFKYMATDNTNFNRKKIFNLSLPDEKFRLVMNDLVKIKMIESIGLVSTPFGSNPAQCGIRPGNSLAEGQNTAAYYFAANKEFVDNMNLRFLAGKNLPVSTSDSAGKFVLINEQTVWALGFQSPGEAIGKTIVQNNHTELQVYGVLRDFCFSNYQFAVRPMILQYNPAEFNVLSIKLKTDLQDKPAREGFLTEVKEVWKSQYPYDELSYSWYEKELYDRYYPGSDMKFLGLVSMIIFIIAMMGLLGMVVYTTEKRIKEIGIRKVLGATVSVIVKDLSWSFVKLIILAAAIVLPLGVLSGVAFMKMFAFNEGVNIGLMFTLFGLVFILAFSTIVINAARAAGANPVKSLRMD